MKSKVFNLNGTVLVAPRASLRSSVPCRVCNRPLTAEPGRSLGIGPWCAIKGRGRALSRLLAGVDSEISPVDQLKNIGYTESDILGCNLNDFIYQTMQVGAIFRNVDVTGRTAASGETTHLASTANASIDRFDLALLPLAKRARGDDTTLSELALRASVLTSGMNILNAVTQTFVRLGDAELSTSEATGFRQRLTQSLIASRLYAHIVKSERRSGMETGADLFGMMAADQKVEQEGSLRFLMDLSCMQDEQIIELMAEKDQEAEPLLRGIVSHAGSFEGALPIICVLDDMNVRGRQIPLAFVAACGSRQPDRQLHERFAEAIWNTETLAEQVNELALAEGDIPHRAVPGGAQSGDRKFLPGFNAAYVPAASSHEEVLSL